MEDLICLQSNLPQLNCVQVVLTLGELSTTEWPELSIGKIKYDLALA